jgi:RNA polymerase sigma-70 factor, ECF subfamily
VTDQEIVKALQSGSQEGFQIFYDKYFEMLYKFCFYRLGQNHTETEDVVGEVMLTAVRKIDDLRADEETRIFSWLAQIARFKLLETYRRLKRCEQEKLFSQFDDGVVDFLLSQSSIGEEEDLIDEESPAQVVGAVLTALPEDYQLVLAEKYLQGRSVREIARRMHRSEKAVESLLTRARDMFRKAHKKMQQSCNGDALRYEGS